MRGLLAVLVAIFGIVCAVIGLAHIVLGPHAIWGAVPVNATMDSEDRFYATYFIAFGVAIAWASRDLVARERLFGVLLLVFFLGGVARIVSAVMVGLPNGLFIFLGSLELILPPLFWFWHRATRTD
jgi:hypothetical protein